MTADLIVIGGGIAGWTAARRAQQLGARVVLVESAPEGPGTSNGRLSGGRIHASHLSPRRPPRDLYEQIIEKTAGTARPDVARAWSENAGRSLDFLISEGAEIAPMEDPGGTAEFRLHALLPTPEMVGRDSPRGTDFTLSRLWQSFLRAGGDF